VVTTDDSLEIVRDKDADATTFEQWYADAHPRIVRAVVVTTGEPDVAADATAEAFSRALERWDRVAGMSNKDGWVYRVAVNDARRRLGRWRRILPNRDRPRLAADPADLIPDAELWDAVRSLNDRQRESIALRYLAGLDERGVASAMGISEGAASSTLSAARARLRKILEEGR
jgi:RNA polymerase sigma-70 factor (ECF subfamily)